MVTVVAGGPLVADGPFSTGSVPTSSGSYRRVAVAAGVGTTR